MREKMVVAVIDSGVDKSDRLLQQREIEDLYYEDREFKTCYLGKLNPHGTEIIKVLLKEAPDIRILSIRTLQEDNRCMISAVIQAITFCIGKGVDVINLSLGSCSPASARLKELQGVCDQAVEKGIVIFAADHNKTGKKSYPANFPGVIGVTATEGQEAYCRVSYENRIVEFSENYVYVPDDTRCIIRRGNSYLCPFLAGMFCRFVDENRVEKSKYIHSFLDFLETFSQTGHTEKIFFDRNSETERLSLAGKRVLYFTDDMDYNNMQMYHMYQEVCDISLCFDQLIRAPYEEMESLLQGADIFFIGALSNRFINANQNYLNALIHTLTALQIEVISVFPVMNTYERMILAQNTDGMIKSIYK